MTRKDIRSAMHEAERFLSQAHQALHKTQSAADTASLFFCPKETGAVRRASMDLTRALAAMRGRTCP